MFRMPRELLERLEAARADLSSRDVSTTASWLMRIVGYGWALLVAIDVWRFLRDDLLWPLWHLVRPWLWGLVIVVGLTSVARAQTGNEETICTTTVVFMCENFQDRALGNISTSMTTSLYKNPAWGVSSGPAIVIEDGTTPSGTTGHIMHIPCPTPPGTSDSGCASGFLDETFTGGPFNPTYVRWYTKWSTNYKWSTVSTKHVEFNTSGASGTGMQIWSSNFDGPFNGGINGQTHPHLQTQAQPAWACTFPSTSGSSTGCSAGATDWIGGIPPTVLADALWHCLEIGITDNGASSWRVEGWIDSVKYLDFTTQIWPVSGTRPIGLLIASQWNCSGPGPGLPVCSDTPLDPTNPNFHPQFDRYHANFIASTSRVSCLGAVPTTPVIRAAQGMRGIFSLRYMVIVATVALYAIMRLYVMKV